eukprot:scaffold103212_cov24-Tisochrysis_lutea.AAC.2
MRPLCTAQASRHSTSALTTIEMELHAKVAQIEGELRVSRAQLETAHEELLVLRKGSSAAALSARCARHRVIIVQPSTTRRSTHVESPVP